MRSARPVRSSTQSTCCASCRPESPCRRPNACEVLARRQERIERHVLRHDTQFARRLAAGQHLAEQPNLAAIEPHASGDRANQRRLAGAVRSEQRQQLAFAELERRAVERRDLAERLRGVRDRQDGHGQLPGMRGRDRIQTLRLPETRGSPHPANGGSGAADSARGQSAWCLVLRVPRCEGARVPGAQGARVPECQVQRRGPKRARTRHEALGTWHLGTLCTRHPGTLAP